ncbi:MAG: DNA-binding protein [Lachnospiraceae bacterium]|nr:DNA-binding protein [Lachnospiraceae bacterium]
MEEQRKSKKSEPVDWLREALTLTRYFDSYGALFDEHQREIFEDYICNDMSLSEIAEREGMTRQGVSDLVKRTSRKLHEYEEHLHLSERTEQAERILGELRERIERSGISDAEKAEMKNLCGRLSETL